MELDQAVSSVRCRFITNTETIRVSSDPLSIPVKLGRKGLSDVSRYFTCVSLFESESFCLISTGDQPFAWKK